MTPRDFLLVDAALAVAVLFALVVAITVEFERLRPAWRRVLFAVVAQQAAITYGAVEAVHLEAEVRFRAIILAGSLVALLVTVVAVLVDRHRDTDDVPDPEGRRG